MDIRQLQIFRSVAQQLNFSKAAEELFIAQPAISIAIKKLETELDTPLFNRTSKKVSLTPEGKALLNHANTILKQVADAKTEMHSLRGLERGEVRIAMPAMLGAYHFPALFDHFMRQHPSLQIYVEEEGTRQIEQHLLDGSIDLGVVIMEQAPETLEVHPLINEEMVVCTSPSHRFAKRDKINAEEFFEENLILIKQGYFLRETIDRLSLQLQKTPKIIFETNLMLLIKRLVLSGKGISTCLQFVLKEETELKGISFDPPIFLPMGLAWKKDHYLSAANRAIVNFLLNPSRLNKESVLTQPPE
ncbi:MAG: LysR family transcriptional regulator [Pseudomonadales bacterium]